MQKCIVCGGVMLATYGGGYDDEPDIEGHYCTACHSYCDHTILTDDHRYVAWDADEWNDCDGWFCSLEDPWLWTYDAAPRPVCPRCWGRLDPDDVCDVCWGEGCVHRDTFTRLVTGTKAVSPMAVFGPRGWWDMLVNKLVS